jgi:hypothetical protein
VAAELERQGTICVVVEQHVPISRVVIAASLVLAVLAHAAGAQAVFRIASPTSAPRWYASPSGAAPTHFEPDTSVSHRRAIVLGATAGVLVGGLASAAYVLNALAPHCVTPVNAAAAGSVVHSSHCGNRSRIVVVQAATIAAGATAGGFAGAWIARRIAEWHSHHHRVPLPNERRS